MLPKDYIRYILTGSFTTEYSDASGMQMLDIYNKCYSNEILDKFAININFCQNSRNQLIYRDILYLV